VSSLKIALVLGTRPEIIKMSPIIRVLDNREIDHFLLHTGQHYDYEMDGSFFDDLHLPRAKYNLRVGSGSHAEQSAKIMLGVEEILSQERPDITLVQGDTNTVCSGALVAAKLGLKLGHVEAGLRSFDRRMPEEINRVVADHLSDILFTPTEVSRKNLLNEGLSDHIIFVTGNTVVDAVKENLVLSSERGNICDKLGVNEGGYFLVTLHRAENVDNRDRLATLLKALTDIRERYSVEVVFPIHPRTKKMIREFGLSLSELKTINPVGYLDFLQLESKARLILTDSGGVQEEACVMRTPCVTLRENTERPETVSVGANIIAGVQASSISKGVDKMMKVNRSWENPYGDGNSGRKIVDILLERC